MNINKRLFFFFGSIFVTLLILRLYLYIFIDTNFYIPQYNVHHLYIGAFFLVIAVLFLILDIRGKFITIFAGVNSALILDEIVFLIATDGSDISYWSNISVVGMLVFTSIIFILVIICALIIKEPQVIKTCGSPRLPKG